MPHPAVADKQDEPMYQESVSPRLIPRHTKQKSWMYDER